MVDSDPTDRPFESASGQSTLIPPVVHDGVIKGLGMSSRVCVTGHIKYFIHPPEDILFFFCFFMSFIYPGLQIGVTPFYIYHQQLPYDAVI